MRPLSNREKKIFFVCLMIISIFILNRGLFKPLQNRTVTLSQKIQKGEKHLRKSLRVSHEYESILKKYEKYLVNFKQEMSDEKEMSAIIAQIESMMTQNQLQFSEMKPQKIVEMDFYKVFSVSLKMNGDLDQINQFLYTLQNVPYFFQVDKLRLEKVVRQKVNLKATLVLSRLLIQKN
ncbi:GTP-binding protein HflX [hydrothermal vent metagenome]|uniref:GTP-binding protein HflX n=1 Tax=hydrothermal vent metagenome TaxID=652676 RepID=A0A3B1CZK4_9ZZZZ